MDIKETEGKLAEIKQKKNRQKYDGRKNGSKQTRAEWEEGCKIDSSRTDIKSKSREQTEMRHKWDRLKETRNGDRNKTREKWTEKIRGLKGSDKKNNAMR